MSIRVITRLHGDQLREDLVLYDDSQIVAGDTLADFRRRRPANAGAAFEDPDSAGRTPLEPGDEQAFPLSVVIGTDAAPKPLVVWSTQYVEEMRLGGVVQLRVIAQSGRSERAYQIAAASLGAMTLDQLRQALVAAHHMTADDRFLDQGVPVDPGREARTDAIEIVCGTGSQRAIEVVTVQEADTIVALARWRELVPPIDATGFRVSVRTPVAADYAVATGPGTAPPPPDATTMADLTLSEQETILRNCGLYPVPLAPETSAALRIGDGEVEFGRTRTVTCQKVRILASQTAREDRVTVSYTKELHKWQSRLVDTSRIGINIPLLFGLKTSRRRADDDAALSKGETVHLTKLLALPKAEVVLEGVSLSADYLGRVRSVVDQKSGKDLVAMLSEDGLFVATHFVIGGMVVGRSSTVLRKESTRNQLAQSFDLEVSGLLSAHHVLRSGQQLETRHAGKTYDVHVKTVGGSGEASRSEPGMEGGADWLLSVATRPQTWRVIGYKDHEIRPILDYFPDDLKRDATELLRDYFASQLVRHESTAVGGDGGKEWKDDPMVGFHNRIAHCSVMLDQVIDSVRFAYAGAAGMLSTPWRGASREREFHFEVPATDEVVAIEVGWNRTIDHLIFHTRNGDNLGRFVGRGRGAVRTHVFQQPRIRGFHGRSGHVLDALGVYYYDLSNGLPERHRSVLLSLERYLYRS